MSHKIINIKRSKQFKCKLWLLSSLGGWYSRRFFSHFHPHRFRFKLQLALQIHIPRKRQNNRFFNRKFPGRQPRMWRLKIKYDPKIWCESCNSLLQQWYCYTNWIVKKGKYTIASHLHRPSHFKLDTNSIYPFFHNKSRVGLGLIKTQSLQPLMENFSKTKGLTMKQKSFFFVFRAK